MACKYTQTILSPDSYLIQKMSCLKKPGAKNCSYSNRTPTVIGLWLFGWITDDTHFKMLHSAACF